jgi:hypothetical protein
MALYIYGLMRRQDAQAAVSARSDQRRSSGRDHARGELETVTHDGVCALVSPIADASPKLRRESALAHNETLQAAFEHGPVLPVRFGTVLPDAEVLERDFLAPQAAELMARLEALQGSAEMQVKATYLEEPLLRSILGASSSLAQAAARIRALPPAATHFDRINLGEAIHRAVDARRRQDAERVVDALRQLAVKATIREPRHEREVVNASFLVSDDRLEAFDSAVERLSSENSGQMQFKLIGPMPAHSFAGELRDGTAMSGGSTWA